MSTHKHFDKICCVVLAFVLIITILFINCESFGVQRASTIMGYEQKLFDTSTVHTIDIIMDDWDEFTATCKDEEYHSCAVVIDNEAYKNVAIRGKGNTSLTQVESYGNNRYSFKIEFDHYDSTKSYHGLDKLCLNNIIQDNTYMKDYLCYQMMAKMGVAAPLCSYVYITVNGEDWGLYLAVEGVEESFLQRNYGKNYGELYKPDSQNMGGGRGNGENFDMNEFLGDTDKSETSDSATNTEDIKQTVSNLSTSGNSTQPNIGSQMPGDIPNGQTPPELPDGQTPTPPDSGNTQGTTPPENNTDDSTPNTSDTPASGNTPPNIDGDKGNQTNGSDDVLLKYIDDNADSYANIFDNAKTDISDDDKQRLISALKKLSNGEDIADVVEIEKVIRYFVVHNFVLNFDSYTGSMIHNYYLYENDGQMQMIPWDYNLAFGGFESAGGATNLVNYPIDSPVSGGNTEDRPMIAWIFASEEYTELYHQYFAEFISEYFESGYFAEMVDSVSSMLAPYVEKDPTKFCTYEEFTTGVATLKEFCLLRAESVRGQLDGTIGSTSSTQTNDTLVDAGDLQISDMGSMNHNGGMGRPTDNTQDSQGTTAELPNNGETTAGNFGSSTPASGQTPSDRPNGNSSSNDTVPTPPTGETQNDSMPTLPGDENTDGQMQKPDDMPGQANSAEPTTSSFTWIYLSVSVVILILGFAFAIFFKRRK